MGKPKLSVMTGTENLGVIYKETNTLVTRYFEQGLPTTTSESKINLALGGVSRVILVQASMDGTGFSGGTTETRINNFIAAIESWCNAVGVQATKTYADSFGNEYTVCLFEFTWVRSNTNPNRIIYSLLMKETLAIT